MLLAPEESGRQRKVKRLREELEVAQQAACFVSSRACGSSPLSVCVLLALRESRRVHEAKSLRKADGAPNINPVPAALLFTHLGAAGIG